MIDVKDLRKKISNLEKDDVLALLGVEERRSAADMVLPALGLFGLGLVVGAGLGLMLAPKPGHQLRQDLKSRLSQGDQQVRGSIDPAAKVGEAAGRLA